MALDDLIARLEQDADAQVLAIAQAADAEIAAIEAATAQALAARREQVLRGARADRQASFARTLADRRRELRAAALQATHAALDRVFVRALALLPSVTCQEAWAAVLTALADEALACVPAGACRLRCGAEMRAILEARFGDDERVTVVEDDAVGPGVVVESLDGTVTVDATIAARLAQRRSALSIGLLNPEVSDA